GKTWSLARQTSVTDVAVYNQQVVVLENDDNHMLQLSVSNDKGKTWLPIFSVPNNACYSLSSENSGLTVHCEKESYFTQDLVHWTSLQTQTTHTLNSYFSGKILYITDGNFIKSSNDHGATWTTLLDNLNQYRAYIAGYQDDVLIIAIANAGIIKMTNGGSTWNLINDGLSNYNFSSLVLIDANHYLVSTDDGIFSTQDGGQHWALENAGLANLHVLNLSLNQNTLLASTAGGLFKTDV
ncbi:MAG: hypothetical protein JO149_05605, partial [Gammaproteobacteria bacterium]|nr:hypothetical protein [Gammaproteobacteria bacterium]